MSPYDQKFNLKVYIAHSDLHFTVQLVIKRLWVRPPPDRQHYIAEIDHEIFSTVIISLPRIQDGQLSVSGEKMRTFLVNRLEDKACPVKVYLGKRHVPIGLTGLWNLNTNKHFTVLWFCLISWVFDVWTLWFSMTQSLTPNKCKSQWSIFHDT